MWREGVRRQGALALQQSLLARHAARVEACRAKLLFFITLPTPPCCWPSCKLHLGLRTLHRPANLEDLFLKLTGGKSAEDGLNGPRPPCHAPDCERPRSGPRITAHRNHPPRKPHGRMFN